MRNYIFILSFFLINQPGFSQKKDSIQMGFLSKHWIQSEKECHGDTLVFRPEGSEIVAEAPMFLLYGGWTFFPEGQVQKFRWKKCGNDEEPPFRSGMWKKKGNLLKIRISKESFLFQLLSLDNEMLKVIDLSKKK